MRKSRRKPSHPKLEALGWDEKEPTEVIDLGLERVRKTASEGDAAFRSSLECVAKAAKKLDELEEDKLDVELRLSHALG